MDGQSSQRTQSGRPKYANTQRKSEIVRSKHQFDCFALKPRLTSVCWAIYVIVTFYIDVQDRKLQELQKLENQTETTGEYIPEYDYYESTDFQLPLRFLQENFQNSRIDILRSQW